MAIAFSRALGQLFDPRILTLLGVCVVLSTGCFVAAWFGVDWLLTAGLSGFVPSSGVVTLLGSFVTLVLAWFLFPFVASAFVLLFLERVARIVEARHYPDLPPAPGLPWLAAIGSSLGFLASVLAANLLLLVLLVFFPIAWPIGYLVVNGWLLGREYFELVALRRISPAAARTMRDHRRPELLLTGIGLTFLFTLPIVNLVIPILATATLVHRFEHWRRTGLVQAGGG
ncbi:MAG TPA: EI24 domain-containing protein [Planctomycetota bacterium]|nr:EI24 domain-containing protein [Planctomycetota bacterium]